MLFCVYALWYGYDQSVTTLVVVEKLFCVQQFFSQEKT